MRNRPFERRKRNAAWTLSSLAWLGTLVAWILAAREGQLPWHDSSPRIDVGEVTLLVGALAGFIAALPDDREDVNEKSLWLFVLWCLIPFLLLTWLYFWPR